MSKSKFDSSKVAYLGHFISSQGVKADLENLKVMGDRPPLTFLKSLRWFLKLTVYYRKFIRDYREIASLLNNLMRKDGFQWNLGLRWQGSSDKSPNTALSNFY